MFLMLLSKLSNILHRQSKVPSLAVVTPPAPLTSLRLQVPAGSSFDTRNATEPFPVYGPTMPLTDSPPARAAIGISDIVPTNIKDAKLEAEIVALKTSNRRWAKKHKGLRNDAVDLHARFWEEFQKGEKQTRQAKIDATERAALGKKLAQYDRFLELAIDIGLHEPVLHNAQSALRSGEDVDAALVHSIKLAAAKPGSPWTSIMLSVDSPHTPSDFQRAVNVALKAKNDLRTCEKVARFWKDMALANKEGSDPSSSDLSDVLPLREPFLQQAISNNPDLSSLNVFPASHESELSAEHPHFSSNYAQLHYGTCPPATKSIRQSTRAALEPKVVTVDLEENESLRAAALLMQEETWSDPSIEEDNANNLISYINDNSTNSLSRNEPALEPLVDRFSTLKQPTILEKINEEDETSDDATTLDGYIGRSNGVDTNKPRLTASFDTLHTILGAAETKITTSCILGTTRKYQPKGDKRRLSIRRRDQPLQIRKENRSPSQIISATTIRIPSISIHQPLPSFSQSLVTISGYASMGV